MDALVTELGDYPVRFTNVFMSDDAAAEAYDNLERYLDEVAPGMNDVDRGGKPGWKTFWTDSRTNWKCGTGWTATP